MAFFNLSDLHRTPFAETPISRHGLWSRLEGWRGKGQPAAGRPHIQDASILVHLNEINAEAGGVFVQEFVAFRIGRKAGSDDAESRETFEEVG